VGVSYIIWILNETPRPMVWKLVQKTPCLSKRVAIYTITEAFSGIFNCLKLNETGNLVLNEFEKFLRREYGIKPQSFFEDNSSTSAKALIEV
jgi:hypothetical protein